MNQQNFGIPNMNQQDWMYQQQQSPYYNYQGIQMMYEPYMQWPMEMMSMDIS